MQTLRRVSVVGAEDERMHGQEDDQGGLSVMICYYEGAGQGGTGVAALPMA